MNSILSRGARRTNAQSARTEKIVVEKFSRAVYNEKGPGGYDRKMIKVHFTLRFLNF